jgi:uncharacterized protein affecting Mg2+/Co2+ transport
MQVMTSDPANPKIRVEVETSYIEEQSDPRDKRFVFSYTITGQGFRYSSGAVIETPVGTMQGSYQMVADDGQQFDAPIAPFRLAMPGVLH